MEKDFMHKIYAKLLNTKWFLENCTEWLFWNVDKNIMEDSLKIYKEKYNKRLWYGFLIKPYGELAPILTIDSYTY